LGNHVSRDIASSYSLCATHPMTKTCTQITHI